MIELSQIGTSMSTWRADQSSATENLLFREGVAEEEERGTD